MKKILYIFIFLAALLGSFSTASAQLMMRTAAANGSTEPYVVLNKIVTPPGPGDSYYWLTLDSYTTGSSSTTTKHTPLDVVLVLDVSGSMEDQLFAEYDSKSYSYDNIGDNCYYYYKGYYEKVVAYKDSRNYRLRYYSHADSSYKYLGSQVSSTSQTIWTGVLLYPTTTDKKMTILKSAVINFINKIADDATQYNVNHKISIVKYSTNASTVNSLLDVSTSENVKTLTQSVNNLSEGGATAANKGMQQANSALGTATPGRKQIVVMFTDGQPTTGTEFQANTANSTVAESKRLKDKAVTVYSVGLLAPFDMRNQDIVNYMNRVSSNYLDATTYLNGTHSSDKYFMNANSPEELDAIFQSIAETEKGTSISLTETSTNIDMLTADFTLPDGAQTSWIKTYALPLTGGTSTQDYTFADPIDPEGDNTGNRITCSVTIEGNKISVSGFNYSLDDVKTTDSITYGNWVGPRVTTSGGITSTVYAGKMLRIMIPIIPSDDNRGGYDIPTNEANSGITATISKEDYDKLDPEIQEGFKRNQDGTYTGDVAYYIPPTTDIPAIAIAKYGLKQGESAHFQVYEAKADGTILNDTTTPVFDVIITGKNATGAAWEYVILKNFDEGKRYAVKEMGWSWAYSTETALKHEVLTEEKAKASMKTEYGIVPGTYLVFPFKNTERDGVSDHAESVVKNVWKSGKEEGKTNVDGDTKNSKKQP